MNQKYDLYGAVRQDGKRIRFSLGSLTFVKKTAGLWDDNKEDTSEKAEKTSKDELFSHHTALSETLQSAVDFCLSQYHNLLLLSSIESGLYQSFVRDRIIDRLNNEAERLGTERDAELFGIGEDLAREIIDADKFGSVLRLGAEKIGPSVFLGMVASFDALIVDIVGKLIRANPERYLLSDRTVPVTEIVESESIESLISKLVSDELYSFSRESHEVQNSYIEKKFAVKIRDFWKRYGSYIEVFERRNLIAHGEAEFNPRYIKNCERADLKGVGQQSGKSVELRPSYLKQAIYLLSEYAILLSFVLWRKHSPETESNAYETLNEAAFKLISDKHYILAERMLTFALGLKTTGVSEGVRKMMVVNCASASAGEDDIQAASALLDKEDWSASAFEFKISVLALKDDVEATIAHLEQAKKSGFPISNFRDWPVFRFVRKSDEFHDALEKVYEQRIRKTSIESSTSDSERDSDSDSEAASDDNSTFH